MRLRPAIFGRSATVSLCTRNTPTELTPLRRFLHGLESFTTSYENALRLLVLVQLVYVNLQIFGIDLIAMLFGIGSLGATGGTTGNNMILGCVLGALLPLFFRKAWFYLVPAILAVLIHLKVSGGALAAAVSSAVFLWFEYPKRRLPLVAATCLAFVLFVAFDEIGSVNARFAAWHHILGRIAEFTPAQFLFGCGPGSFKYAKIVVGCERFVQAHCELLQWVYELGLVGLLLSCAFAIFLFRKFAQNRNVVLFSCLCGFIANSFVSYTFHMVVTSMTFLVVLALFVADDGERHDKRPANNCGCQQSRWTHR